jgi:uncharacterized membrane protein YhiD involved in acid resistance
MNNLLASTVATQDLTIIEILLNLTISFAMGLGIFITYKKTFQGVLYQKTFNVSLVAITIILTFIIMIIRENVILSLGMIGALSIVRFRTPIKDPMDLIFIFWSIAIGIANGVGLFEISAIASLFIICTLFLMLKLKDSSTSYLLILHLSDQQSEPKIFELIKKFAGKYTLKSKSINAELTEIILEIKIKNEDTNFINQISSEPGVSKATLITANEDLSSF